MNRTMCRSVSSSVV